MLAATILSYTVLLVWLMTFTFDLLTSRLLTTSVLGLDVPAYTYTRG